MMQNCIFHSVYIYFISSNDNFFMVLVFIVFNDKNPDFGHT